MGVKRVFKKFLKYLIPTLLVLLIIPVTTRRHKPQTGPESFRKRPLRCALSLGEADKMQNGFLTGFNYELLKDFGAVHSDSGAVVISLSDGGASYLDSLLLDSLDILVMPSALARLLDDSFSALSLGDTAVSWVLKSDPYRGREVMRWFNSFKATEEYSLLTRRFFAGYNPYRKSGVKDPGIISPYDELLKAGAKVVGWDWKLLAALVWSESMFRIQARSPRGALGLMQMMPRTAGRFGVEDMLDPEVNIDAGARYLAMLQRMFSAYTTDPEMLTRLTIAAYNCGQGRALEDLDGREQSAETAAYIKAVLNQYDIFRGVPPRYQESLDTTTALLRPDGLGGIDPRDEQARNQQQEHDDKVGKDI